ncbi:MAG: peptidoglycan DD-metalloendopeptidase family protein [candidate division Zixibacteria bacterium]|nr:peptidoglycan DD-metalloendopeptidase family protein [candidate division Zixibacteria bacterium]
MLAFLLIGSIYANESTAKLKESRQQLQEYKKQVVSTQKKIDSLKSAESHLQKAISSYNDNVNRNRAIIDKFNRDLKSTQNRLNDNQQKLINTEDRLLRLRQSYRGLLVDYYTNREGNEFGDWDYANVLARSRMAHYLSAISGSSTRELTRADDSIRFLSETMDSLSSAGSHLNKLKKEKRAKIALDLTLKEKDETNLGSVQRETNYLRDRLVSLSEIARQMESIIATLEESQRLKKERGQVVRRFASGSFSGLKGKMSSPIKGKIVTTFGWKTNKTTNLKSFSPGIDIRPVKGRKSVLACAAGRVVYVGNLRGYNNFVIVEHDDDYYTMYAGMTEVAVNIDDIVSAGNTLGTVTKGNVRFEIRKGREHLDPVIWLDIDEI